MKICVKCKKEMKCTYTGKLAVWNRTHCYAGDEFECSDCGAKVLVTTGRSFHEDAEKYKEKENAILDMDGSL